MGSYSKALIAKRFVERGQLHQHCPAWCGPQAITTPEKISAIVRRESARRACECGAPERRADRRRRALSRNSAAGSGNRRPEVGARDEQIRSLLARR